MNPKNEERIKFAINELFEKGNLDVVHEIFTNNYIVHAGNKDYKGRELIKRFTKQLRSAIPDIRVEQVSFLNQVDQTITWQCTFSGKHIGNMMGIPASGKNLEWNDMLVTRFEGDKIAEEWSVSELAGQLLLKLP